VTLAGNGRVALEKLATAVFDLVLMDCQMPDMDGFEATRRIRALESGTGRHLPILAMTAHAMTEDRDRCLAEGMDDYLTKPISREALLRGVSQWLPMGPHAPRQEASDLPAPPAELELDLVQFQSLWVVFNRNPQEMRSVLLSPFFLKSEEVLRDFRHGIAAGERTKIRFAAHTLKGSSRTLGLAALGRIAEQLDQESDTASMEVLSTLIEQADKAFTKARDYLQTFGRT